MQKDIVSRSAASPENSVYLPSGTCYLVPKLTIVMLLNQYTKLAVGCVHMWSFYGSCVFKLTQ